MGGHTRIERHRRAVTYNDAYITPRNYCGQLHQWQARHQQSPFCTARSSNNGLLRRTHRKGRNCPIRQLPGRPTGSVRYSWPLANATAFVEGDQTHQCAVWPFLETTFSLSPAPSSTCTRPTVRSLAYGITNFSLGIDKNNNWEAEPLVKNARSIASRHRTSPQKSRRRRWKAVDNVQTWCWPYRRPISACSSASTLERRIAPPAAQGGAQHIHDQATRHDCRDAISAVIARSDLDHIHPNHTMLTGDPARHCGESSAQDAAGDGHDGGHLCRVDARPHRLPR